MPSFATTLANAVYRGLGTYPLQEIDDFGQRLEDEVDRLCQDKTVAFVPGHDDDEDVKPADNLNYGPGFEKLLLTWLARLPDPPEDLYGM